MKKNIIIGSIFTTIISVGLFAADDTTPAKDNPPSVKSTVKEPTLDYTLSYYRNTYTSSDFTKVDELELPNLIKKAEELKVLNNYSNGDALNEALATLFPHHITPKVIKVSTGPTMAYTLGYYRRMYKGSDFEKLDELELPNLIKKAEELKVLNNYSNGEALNEAYSELYVPKIVIKKDDEIRVADNDDLSQEELKRKSALIGNEIKAITGTPYSKKRRLELEREKQLVDAEIV